MLSFVRLRVVSQSGRFVFASSSFVAFVVIFVVGLVLCFRWVLFCLRSYNKNILGRFFYCIYDNNEEKGMFISFFFLFHLSVCSSTSFCGWNLLKYHAEPNIVDGGSNQSTVMSSPIHFVSVALIPLQRSTSRIHFFIVFCFNPFFFLCLLFIAWKYDVNIVFIFICIQRSAFILEFTEKEKIHQF